MSRRLGKCTNYSLVECFLKQLLGRLYRHNYLSPGPPVISLATSQYNIKPVNTAKNPFQAPNSALDGIIFASCSQDNTANIIPNEDKTNQKKSKRALYSGLFGFIVFLNMNDIKEGF